MKQVGVSLYLNLTALQNYLTPYKKFYSVVQQTAVQKVTPCLQKKTTKLGCLLWYVVWERPKPKRQWIQILRISIVVVYFLKWKYFIQGFNSRLFGNLSQLEMNAEAKTCHVTAATETSGSPSIFGRCRWESTTNINIFITANKQTVAKSKHIIYS